MNWDDLKHRFKSADILHRLIYINAALFILQKLVKTIGYLFGNRNMPNYFVKYAALDGNFKSLIYKPWSIISYSFLHADILHLAINLVILYIIGKLFIKYFTQKQLLNFYFFGTFFGGLIFILNDTFLLAFSHRHGLLIGASAGVMAIFIGIATYIPHHLVKVPLLGFVKLWVVAVVFIGIDLIQIPEGNSGGHLAHLGGALFGYLSIKYRYFSFFKTIDLSKISKYVGAVFLFNRPDKDKKKREKILEKIRKSGYDALSKSEKQFLFQKKNDA